MSSLGGLRKRIDSLDDGLLAILNRRAKLVHEVFALKLKQARGGTVRAFVPGREAEILRRLSSRKAGAFPVYGIVPVFREIISACRSLEELPRISYVGAADSKAHQAALNCFGSVAEFVARKKVAGVFDDLEKGRADYGVLPVADASGGGLKRSLEFLSKSDLKICAEVSLLVRYFVIGKACAQPTGRDRTSVLLKVIGNARSLEALLKPLVRRQLTLNSLESWPLRGKSRGTSFLLDFNGHQDDPKIHRLLSNLAQKVAHLKVLGSYPAV